MTWKNESHRHALAAKGVTTKQIFSKINQKKYSKIDVYWDDELKGFVKDYLATAALYKDVAIFENYIPLWSPRCDMDMFEQSKPGVLYIWNINNIDTDKFDKIVAEIENDLGDKYEILAESDSAGFGSHPYMGGLLGKGIHEAHTNTELILMYDDSIYKKFKALEKMGISSEQYAKDENNPTPKEIQQAHHYFKKYNRS
jgi:hypothetical protein